MLEIRELAVSYGPVLAVRQINVDVNMGEVVAMIGPNGAGKTSTLRAISGLVSYQGSIVFDGVDTKKSNIEGLAASRCMRRASTSMRASSLCAVRRRSSANDARISATNCSFVRCASDCMRSF